METHFLYAKRKCYNGDKPESFIEYCTKNNRIYCGTCDKLYRLKSPCEHVRDNFDTVVDIGQLGASAVLQPGYSNVPVTEMTLDGDAGCNFSNIPYPTNVSLDNLFLNAVQSDLTDLDHLGVLPGSVAVEQTTSYNLQSTGHIFATVGNDFIVNPGLNTMDALLIGMKTPVATLTCVPLQAVRTVTDVFNRIIKMVIGAPSLAEYHARVLLFTPFVLAKKSDKKKKQWKQVKERAKSFIDASLEDIIRTIEEDACAVTSNITPLGPSMKSIKRLISLGRYSDAMKMLDSNGVHKTTPEIINILQEKHPEAPMIEKGEAAIQFIQFTNDQVLTALKSFTNGSSGGPFALVERMLKDMVAEPQIGHILLENLAEYCSLFVAGKFPIELAPFYGGARLIPLVKKDGGVRPMAVGDTLRRLACKLALTLISGNIKPTFLPHQLGIGTPNGGESIIHSVAAIMEKLEHNECILQVDFTNAFNLVSREKFLELVKEHFHPIWNITNYLYTSQGILRIGNGSETILSCSGVQQGCPLSPLLFAVVLREITSNLENERCKLLMNSWFLDDGHIAGKVDDVIKCLNIIETNGIKLGLKLNLKKCVVYGANVDNFPRDIIRNYEGLIVLGAPIGSDSFVKAVVNKQIYKASVGIFKTSEINDPQMELLLLRCCTGSPKMTYWQRTCAPAIIKDELIEFDMAIDRSLHHILGTPIFGADRRTVHLPLSMGGLGIPIASISSEAAFVASVGASWDLQPNTEIRGGFNEARLNLINNGTLVPDLSTKSNNVDTPLLTKSKEFSQKKFMLVINGKIREEIGAAANVKKEIIMKGRSCKGANYWLTTPPNNHRKTVIDGSAFRALLKYSIGLPLLNGSHRCPDCGKIQDNYGHHALSCRVASGSIDKHNSIVDNIFRRLKKAHITCSSEAYNPMKDNRERPGDIYMPAFDVYGDAFFDVSVISICAESYFTRAAKGQLEGSKIRYDAKMKKYPDLGYRFKPLVIESTGGWHMYSFDYLKTLAEHIATKSNMIAKDVLNELLTTVSCCLQRHQGTMLVRRCLGL